MLVGLLGVCCIGLVLAATYPFAVSDPMATNPPGERFVVAVDGEHRVTGRIVVDGSVRLAFIDVAATDGTRYQRVDERGVTTERFWTGMNRTAYERFVIEQEAEAERLRAEITDAEDRTLLSEERTVEGHVLIVRTREMEPAEISGAASVVARSLAAVEYRRTGSASSQTAVYEPRSGWYEGMDGYRVTAATGEARTRAGTMALVSATVSWEVTAPAGTYAAYALTRLTSDDPRTYEIALDADAGAPELDPPAWVAAARDARAASG